MNIATALLVSFVLLVANAFFVAGEFAIVASKRHRLEVLAAKGSRAARAAVRASRELSLMLAGAQLGITLCTLGLGALAKPAVADLLEPLFRATGLSHDVSYIVAVAFAVSIVVFLHMVVGEMAPKSWAISHPERSALLLALPFRAFTWISRPALSVLNGVANATLRAFKVESQDMLAHAHGPEDLRILLAQSREHGMLEEPDHRRLSGVLRLQSKTLADVMVPATALVSIPVEADSAAVEEISGRSGRSRLVVLEGTRHVGIVHVREAVRAMAGSEQRLVGELMQTPLRLDSGLPLIGAVSRMRQEHVQLALVTDPTGHVVGLTALEDLIEEILGEFDDETDPSANL